MREFLTWDGWNAVTLAAVVIGLVACVAFIVRYQIDAGWSWWRQPDGAVNHFGRYLMIRKILLAALFTVVLLNRLASGWAAQEFVTAALMVAFALHTFVPYRLLIEAQKAQVRREARK